MIKIKNLSFQYGSKKPYIIKDLNYEFQNGTITTLLGLNGSGKTTLIKQIVRIYNPSQGQILVDDLDLQSLSIKACSKKISYVAQRSNAIDDFIIKDYLLFGNVNRLSFYRRPTKEDERMVEGIAKKLNCEHLLSKSLGEISGGERQIIAICSALIQNTPYIVLDEPMSALDIKNQHKILLVLKEICQNEGKTIILSTHNPNHALFLDSKVCLLKEGIIFDYGKAKDIINIKKLESIYGEHICFSKDLNYYEISFKN